MLVRSCIELLRITCDFTCMLFFTLLAKLSAFDLVHSRHKLPYTVESTQGMTEVVSFVNELKTERLCCKITILSMTH